LVYAPIGWAPHNRLCFLYTEEEEEEAIGYIPRQTCQPQEGIFFGRNLSGKKFLFKDSKLESQSKTLKWKRQPDPIFSIII
jgi:hypothetical protein